MSSNFTQAQRDFLRHWHTGKAIRLWTICGGGHGLDSYAISCCFPWRELIGRCSRDRVRRVAKRRRRQTALFVLVLTPIAAAISYVEYRPPVAIAPGVIEVR
jgi:hypothetical protein